MDGELPTDLPQQTAPFAVRRVYRKNQPHTSILPMSANGEFACTERRMRGREEREGLFAGCLGAHAGVDRQYEKHYRQGEAVLEELTGRLQ